MRLRRLIAVAAGAAALAAPAFSTTPAHADRCEPTEPVVRVVYQTYEEPVNEADSPFCYVMLNYVYPRICDDSSTLLGTANPPTPGCVKTLNPDPYEPVRVAPYSPDAGRVTCNAVGFVVFIAGQTATCSA